ncbi:hypothetical protein RU94_GL000135 [Enterococcus asini]|nr:hypothetical protein RU94_GL000135 [Enterococcus asini]
MMVSIKKSSFKDSKDYVKQLYRHYVPLLQAYCNAFFFG